LTATRTNIRFILLAAAVAVLSAAAGFSLWQLQQIRSAPPLASLKVLPEPRVLADFALVDQAGQPFSLERLRGRWSLLFFGFTHCPDICPGTLYDLGRVHQALNEADQDLEEHQVAFVSVDPERDTPERMAEYVSFFDPDFLGITGELKQISPLALRIGVAYRIEPHEPGSENYAVDHSASVFLIDPQARLHGVFPSPHDPELMIQDLLMVLD
jgi:protein SCO1/2